MEIGESQPSAAETGGGLTSAEASLRLQEHGANRVEQQRSVAPWRLLLGQFRSPVVWLLLAATAVSVLLGDLVDAIAIGAIVALNALVGFVQEFRAERAVQALGAMTAPRARVLRDGRAAVISAADVVPGDLLLLEAGDIVPADATVAESNSLLLSEAALTGESTPVAKSVAPVDESVPLAERQGALFMGTSVLTGSGRGVVEKTGMSTELGKIAHLLGSVEDEDTPLEKRLAKVSRVLLLLCLGVVAVVALLGLARERPLIEVFLSAVSLSVATVPEGLPAVVTLALALGVQRMAARKVLVRRLSAVETLGCATVICTDKTGTLTTGVMAAREIWGERKQELIFAACACSDAELDAQRVGGTGDPTEVALLLLGAEHGVYKEVIESEQPRLATQPFDSVRKRMSVRRKGGTLYVKGALESTLPLCVAGTEGALAANQAMAERGLRVLAVAVGQGEAEEELTLLGLIGIADPPRPEAITAVAAARAAGIVTVMITGDHSVTAHAIARELGITTPESPTDELVFARATPEDKIGIVKLWKERGHVVAMTGDGVNDAPALREAHIGIAMGVTGTEVSRQASDMILADDNFASIVGAVREGRGIYDNIQKTLVYLLSGNASELCVMFGAALLGVPMPLLPLHLLWINLATDGLPALALVIDPISSDAMQRPPRRPDDPMLARPQWLQIAATAAIEGTVTLLTFLWTLDQRGLEPARNLAFSVLVFAELFRAFSARSPQRTFWEVGALSNLRLVGVVLVSVLVQVSLYHLPLSRALFHLAPLSLVDGLCALGLGLVPVTVLEFGKLVRRAWRAP